MISKTGKLLIDNSENEIISDSAEMLRRAGYADCYIEQFTDNAVGLLNDYAKLLGPGTKVEYVIAKRFSRMELALFIQGKEYDPFNSGSGAKKRRLAGVVSMNLNTETARVSYRYSLGRNIISVSIPLSEKRRSIFKNPTFIAVVSGVILGFLCKLLPESANSFIVNDIASPLMSVILGVISGIMGPVIFISLVTSIITMNSINDLTNLGFKIIKRFIVSILFLIAVSIAVSALFFRSFGTESFSFEPKQLIQMIFDIIPTNPFKAFLDNNTPQLVVLGFLLGSALLLLGDAVSGLKNILTQVNDWIMSAMRIVLMIVPAIPFLSIFTSIAKGSGAELLGGWKFIAASYAVFTICVAVKAVKTSMVSGVKVSELWNGMKSIVKMAFTTGSTAAPIKKAYEVSEREFNIKPEFTSFWIPMCSAMLSPKTAINVVIASFMVAELCGMAISVSFLLVLILITLELSIASPGTTSAWAIVFVALSMPVSYVGIFAAYRLLTENYSAACTEAYSILEEVEAAHKLGSIKSGNGADGPLHADGAQ